MIPQLGNGLPAWARTARARLDEAVQQSELGEQSPGFVRTNLGSAEATQNCWHQRELRAVTRTRALGQPGVLRRGNTEISVSGNVEQGCLSSSSEDSYSLTVFQPHSVRRWDLSKEGTLRFTKADLEAPERSFTLSNTPITTPTLLFVRTVP